MPFKSEKQRKYLWANEPEIARDWTKTYGSKVKKADGGRIGFYKGSDRHGGTGKNDNSAADRANKAQASRRSSTGNTGGGGNRENYVATRTYTKPTIKKDPREYGKSNRNLNRSFLDNVRQKSIDSFVDRNKYKNLINAGVYNKQPGMMAKILGFMNPPSEVGMYDEDDIKTLYAGGANPKGLGELRKDFEFEEKFSNPTTKEFRDYYNLDQPTISGGGGEGGGNPYIYPTTPVASAAESSEQSDFDKYLAGLGGDYLVPIDYVQNRTRAATGGLMDIVDRESIIKTPDEEIVTNQMEEIEGQMAGPEWFTLRVQELMQFEDMSYEEASEQAYEEGPYGGDYAQGGRVPAAFGGIMDTYSGRRKYGFGSFFKSITKPIKKILKSPLGKAAAMAGLGYLATPGTGASIFSPKGKGSWWKKLLLDSVDSSGRSADVPGLLTKGKKLLSNPFVSIPCSRKRSRINDC